jgi:hypothetical protein
MVAVDPSGTACAARKRAVFHAMGSKTMPRSPAFPPVLTRYKLLEIERPHYGERSHHGEAIATGFVESTVNEVVSKRFGKKQQMQWSKEGAHLLLQTRVRTLNGELGAIFKRWYPDMDLEVEEMPVAA